MSDFFDRVVKNSAWNAVGSIGSALLSLLFAGLTVRWLGLDNAGFVLAVGAVAALNSIFGELGFGTAAVRYLSDSQARNDGLTARKIIGTSFSVGVVFGLLGFVILWFGADPIVRWTKYGGDHSTAVLFCRLTGLTVLFRQMMLAMVQCLESYQRFDVLATRNLTFDLSQGLLGMLFLGIFPSIITAGLLSLVLASLNFLVLWISVRRIAGYSPRPGWDWQMFRQLWQFGRWSYLSSLAALYFGQADRILITILFGGASLPIYSMARRSYDIGHDVLVRQTAYLFPMLSAEADQKETIIERIEPRVRWFISVISTWFYSTVILLGPGLLDAVVGNGFGSHTAPYIVVFSVVGLLHAQSIIPWHLCYATDRVGLTCVFQMLCLFGILPAMFVLGRFFGFTGAVCGQLFIALPLLLFYHVYWRNLPTKEKIGRFFKPLVTALLLYGVTLMLWGFMFTFRVSFWAQLAIGGLFALVYLPAAIRLENAVAATSNASATLMRVAEKISAKLPVPRFALKLIFGKTPDWQ